VAHGIPTDNSGPDQLSPLDRLTPHPGKKEKLNNKQQQKRHVAKKAECPSTKEGGGEILTEL
jgi:hypothetical protein